MSKCLRHHITQDTENKRIVLSYMDSKVGGARCAVNRLFISEISHGAAHKGRFDVSVGPWLLFTSQN